MDQPACPTCDALLPVTDGLVACENGHRFTGEGLALAGNLAAVKALWLAIRALEDDAAGLDWVVRHGREPHGQRDNYAQQAAEGRQAAETLRSYAHAAQDRLDRLRSAPSRLQPDSS